MENAKKNDSVLSLDCKMLHTFAILAYKDSPYLEAMLISLKGQKVESTLLLCTSTPSIFLEELAEKYGCELRVGTRLGLADDWNFACSQVQTPYFTLAHQDDIYQPDYAGKVITAFEGCPESVLVFTGAYELKDNIKTNSFFNIIKRAFLFLFLLQPKQSITWIKKMPLCFGSAIMCPSVSFNKKNIGDFAFNPDFLCNCDWNAWLNLAENKGYFIYIKEELLGFRLSSSQHTSRFISSGVRQREDKILFERIWPAYLVPFVSRLYALAYRHYK